MILAKFTSEEIAIIICIATIVAYCIIMLIKKKIIGDSVKKVARVIDFVINILVLLTALLLILYLTGNLNYETIKSFVVDNIEQPVAFLVGTAYTIIISGTLYSTVKIILKRPLKIDSKLQKRRRTLTKVTLSFLRYTIYIVDVIIILALLGINVGPLLAGVGIAGIVIGLGAQKLITDFISGVFIIFEKHFDVGDVIEVNGFKGEVIDIGLKTTRLCNWKGEVRIIANGNITEVINYSLNNSIAIVDFQIAYKEDIGKVIDLLNLEVPKRLHDQEDLLTIPKVLGTSELKDNAVGLTMTATTVNECHYGVQRAMRKVIKEVLQENNIEIPFPQLVVNRGNDE